MKEETPPDVSQIFIHALEAGESDNRESYLNGISGEVPEEIISEVRSLIDAFETPNPALDFPHFVPDEIKTERAQKSPQKLPREFGNYTLLQEIGRGGMGIVYKAAQKQLAREVALKMVSEVGMATQSDVLRFYAEAQSAAGLNHPGIVPVYEAGSIDGQHFFTMGFVEGIGLDVAIKKNNLTLPQKLYLIEGIAKAVAFAHDQGVIHRDLKPANILLSIQSTSEDAPHHLFPQITDFGLAKRLDQDLHLTLTGQILGTPSYISPEQIAGKVEEMNETTDIYAIGALLYHLLSGKPPYKGDSVMATLLQASTGIPDDIRSVGETVPKDLNTICHKCLEKDSAKRYQSAHHLLADLDNYRNRRPLTAKPSGVIERFIKLCQRRPTATVSWSLGLLLVGISIILPTKMALNSKAHSKELEHKNTQLSSKSLAQVAALRTSEHERARSELSNAILLARGDNQIEALRTFLSAAKIARTSGEEIVEKIARYNLGTFPKHLWTLAQIYDAGEQLNTFDISQDTKTLAAISETRDLIILNSSDGQILHQQDVDEKAFTAAFDPSGNILAAGCAKETIRFWKRQGDSFVDDGKIVIAPLDHSSAIINRIGFSSDGKTLFSKGGKRSLYLWNTETREQIGPPLKHQHEIFDAAISSKSHTLVSFTRHGHIYGWDPITGAKKFGPVYTTQAASRGAVDATGNRLLVTKESFRPGRFYDISKCNHSTSRLEKAQFFPELGPARSGIFGDHTSSILFCNFSRSLNFHDIDTLEQRSYPLKFENLTLHFYLRENDRKLYTLNSRSQQIASWNSPATWTNPIFVSDNYLRDPILATDKDSVLSVRGNKLYRASKMKHHRAQTPDFNLPPAVVLPESKSRIVLPNPSRKSIILIGFRGNHYIKEFDASSLTQLSSFSHDIPHVHTACISKDGSQLAIIYRTSSNPETTTLYVTDLDTGKTISHALNKNRTLSAAFSSVDPNHLLIASDWNTVSWIDCRDGKTVRSKKIGSSGISAISVHHDKGLVAMGTTGRTAAVFREQDWAKISPDVLHNLRIGLLDFTLDGNFVISTEHGNTGQIWEVTSGLPVGPPITHSNRIRGIHASDDGKDILTICESGRGHRWPTPTKDTRDLEAIEDWLDKHFSFDF